MEERQDLRRYTIRNGDKITLLYGPYSAYNIISYKWKGIEFSGDYSRNTDLKEV